MIVDFHHHYLPEQIFLARGGVKGQVVRVVVDGKDANYLHDWNYDLDRQLADMDEAGIDLVVLSCANGGESFQEAKDWSDGAARAIKAYPGRLVALAPTQPTWGPEALTELDRAVRELGMRGVSIRSQVLDCVPLDSHELWPFYETVSRLDVPIFVHPSRAAQGFAAVDTDWNSNITLTREFDLMTAICRVIMGGVLEKFPTLKFVFSHMGGGIAALWERVERYATYWGPKFWGWDRKTSPLSRPVRDYLDMLYFDMAGAEGGMNAVRCALTTLKPEQLVFGTDYPAEFTNKGAEMRRYIQNIRGLDLPPEQTEAMLGGTARRLLKLDR